LKGVRKAKVRVATKSSRARFLPAVVRRSVCALWFPLPKIGLAVAVVLPCEEKATHHKEEPFPFREARVKRSRYLPRASVVWWVWGAAREWTRIYAIEN
jgi:hypothetical protein